MDHNQHWASDVAAGAALGLSTARFVMNRREVTADKTVFSIAPGEQGGVMFTFQMPLH
jgi:membrane-associated phospholipid phosphatase